MNLWPHQQRVFDLVTSGKNVILQSPTGSGKTRAALYPFLTAMDYQHDHYRNFPQKCIYSVPMRVLAKQFKDEYEKTVETYNRKYGLNISVAIQTGEQPEDREFASNMIFATIDQTLSSFLLSPYSLPRRKANLNAAAVLTSYLVFDEFHLYEPDSMLPTTLHMLQLLKGITPFVLMTATFSHTMLQELGHLLDAVVVPGNEAARMELRNLESQQKTRRYHVSDNPLSAERVWECHQDRSVVICNTIERAKDLYIGLKKIASADTEILLLHSRLLKVDDGDPNFGRETVENRIKEQFARGKRDGSFIAISTQAIEVGVDITSATLHTELAPANSIIQRAGRCARYENDDGNVYIYSKVGTPEGEVDLCEKTAPYVSKSQVVQFVSTLAQFRERSGHKLEFSDEQDVVNAVHGPHDRQIIQQLQMGAYEHRRRMFAVMRGDDTADARHLIREVLQQQVTIHSNPDELLESPFDVPSFGVHPGTLQGYVKDWLERYQADEDIPWAVKWLCQVPRDDSAEQANESRYRWEAVENPKAAMGAPLLVVHPLLATYDKELGFLSDQGGDWEAKLPERERRTEENQYGYRLETYEAHIAQVHKAFNELWPELDCPAHKLEAQFGWESGSVRRAAELAVLLHDVGKLSVKWQGWVRKYQDSINEPVDDKQAYAHTELQTDDHRHKEKQMGKRPWHAVEGAVAVMPILIDNFGVDHPLILAAFSAIARHHAPYSDSNQEFRLVHRSPQFVAAAAGMKILPTNLLGLNENISPDFGAKDAIAHPDDSDHTLAAYLAYLLIVRVLRRSDQLGTARGTKGI